MTLSMRRILFKMWLPGLIAVTLLVAAVNSWAMPINTPFYGPEASVSGFFIETR